MIGIDEARQARARIATTYRANESGFLTGWHEHAGKMVHEVFFVELAQAGRAPGFMLDDENRRTEMFAITPALRAVFPECAADDVALVFRDMNGGLTCATWPREEFARLVEDTGARLFHTDAANVEVSPARAAVFAA